MEVVLQGWPCEAFPLNAVVFPFLLTKLRLIELTVLSLLLFYISISARAQLPTS
ncbi:hypothetical protein DL95DRAFT_393476 [Leptodontidium sp. 2 PMI_412]|nr:hypothetical protein DL95DRAFT_393476 [Leptodontidium sp. 2 PMI_412]